MEKQDKINEELIKELQELRKENDLLKIEVKNTSSENKFIKLLTEVATTFVQNADQKIDQKIIDAQQLICDFLGLDLSSIYQPISESSPSLKLAYEYHRYIKNKIPDILIASEYFPWCEKILLSGAIPVVNSMNDLPIEAAKDRESWNFFGIKSSIMFPLIEKNGQVMGTISFDAIQAEYFFSDDLILNLKLAAQLFADAIMLQKKEIIIENKIKDLQWHYDIAIQRELKMVELKNEINELLVKSGKEKTHNI